MTRVLRILYVLAAAPAVTPPAAEAQLRRPRAEVTPLVETNGAHAGGPVRVALKVTLPEGLHTQSNKPRDPLFIPTEVFVEPPAGVTFDEIVWPPSTDLKQEGQDQPPNVFEHEFAIGVRLTLAASVPLGDLAVPVRLRYQACDATLCYPPATAETQWAVRVVSASTTVAAEHADVFKAIPFGTGERPAPPDHSTAKPTEPAPPSGSPDAPLAALDDFVVLSTTGGYLRTAPFLDFIRNAESGVKEKGMFEGRGPLMILLLVFIGGLALNLTPCVLPMIPINLAIIGAGAKAGSRARGFLLGAAYGGAMALVYGVLGLVVILTAGTFGQINASPWFNAGIAALFILLGLT